ncbi:MAG: lipoyl(octanoyl) transferase LipB [Fimbriimonas ginsengisoli]|uniref:Octanoyltransferase n=1 Tax=Fimbriimonas ginsengisoli TaxID=1005039 RepID=A0A931LXR6_FIMGI|nr:lipoyl(octanoyl) transferase LipB [Fimbriimonas ginsengisoli]MBI3721606.1 lipoyl(octanoyl) transferase LipB [Fimbriimonas ginsengisoli]
MKYGLADLGTLAYGPCAELQAEVLEQVASGSPGVLIFVEHPAVLTLGAGFHADNLLFTPADYAKKGIEVVRTDRGGDVTFHGPRQLVVYPIFDVARHGKDLHRWMRDLEQTIILAAAEFGVEARRFSPHTGVWVGERKLAAIGVKIRRWVSMHGVALNCDNDLSPFQLIVPCGIKGYGVTSLSCEVGRTVTMEDAKPTVRRAFEEVFGVEFEPVSLAATPREMPRAAG